MRDSSHSGSNRHLPGVDTVLSCNGADELMQTWGRELVVFAIRRTIDDLRHGKRKLKKQDVSPEQVLSEAATLVHTTGTTSLRQVINATGIILHTNLGRAPFGKAVHNALAPVLRGYSNLEFNLEKGRRGHRNSHISRLLTFLTGAEAALVVNNNAGAVILTLHTFARGREVVVSRGELIEIGGEFRIPDIMAASGARMVEVGTTNRTRSLDYERAITPDTALLFKAHKSNYTISGFTEEVAVAELAGLAHARNLPLVYDIGSGLLRKPKIREMAHEPDVRTALSQGADLVTFSGDKLLGGPQAGIIVGKRALVEELSRAPLMRALRVGKLTLAALSGACRSYLQDNDLIRTNPIFMLLERPLEERKRLAEKLAAAFEKRGIQAGLVESKVMCGGGSLPDLTLPGFAVALSFPSKPSGGEDSLAEQVFDSLLLSDTPVLGVLREGRLLFDTGALFEEDIETVAEAVAASLPGR
jgi:L-seryl-tRNA(Ser) seleniumtransferase